MIHSASRTYLFYGILFGLLFPIMATLMACYQQYGAFSLDLLIQTQKTVSLIWIIDTAPFFLGTLAWIAGHKQDRIVAINDSLEDQVKEQTLGLLNINETLKKEIEQRKKREIELIESKEAAEEGVRAKDQFLSNMSHEIRTPMNGILGMTNLLLDTALTQPQKDYLSAIDYSAKNLLVIINDILDLSKINAEKLILEKVNFNLMDVLESVDNMFRFKAQEKGIDLKIDLAEHVPFRLCGDPVRLGQILLNLTGNAVKFTHSGKVEVRVALVKESEADVSLNFEVIDTGVGINEKHLNSIFEHFAQANDSTSRLYGGTGLGLSISKKLIELFGGDLTLQSTEGVGSTFGFSIVLKKCMGEESSELPDAAIDVIDRSKARILLVEDNKINQIVAKGFLEKHGFVSDIANNGKEAIQKLKSQRYDLVLMDIQMPEMDGLTATRLIRQGGDGLTSEVKIIAMTASVLQKEIETCYQAGMDDYVSKPFDPEELLSKMDRLLSQVVAPI